MNMVSMSRMDDRHDTVAPSTAAIALPMAIGQASPRFRRPNEA